MRLLPAGPRSLLAEVASLDEAGAVYAAVRAAGLQVLDAVPAARTVLFEEVADVPELAAFLTGLDLDRAGAARSAGRLVEVPTSYDGADLEEVAGLWGRSPEEVVALHTATEFVVAFLGFRPGFAYCAGLPAELSVPRLPRPRTRVPAGAVALAGAFTGVYPSASPGGWRLVGRTDLVLWDPGADPPALLAPGTRVRFTAVSR